MHESVLEKKTAELFTKGDFAEIFAEICSKTLKNY